MITAWVHPKGRPRLMLKKYSTYDRRQRKKNKRKKENQRVLGQRKGLEYIGPVAPSLR